MSSRWPATKQLMESHGGHVEQRQQSLAQVQVLSVCGRIAAFNDAAVPSHQLSLFVRAILDGRRCCMEHMWRSRRTISKAAALYAVTRPPNWLPAALLWSGASP